VLFLFSKDEGPSPTSSPLSPLFLCCFEEWAYEFVPFSIRDLHPPPPLLRSRTVSHSIGNSAPRDFVSTSPTPPSFFFCAAVLWSGARAFIKKFMLFSRRLSRFVSSRKMGRLGFSFGRTVKSDYSPHFLLYACSEVPAPPPPLCATSMMNQCP